MSFSSELSEAIRLLSSAKENFAFVETDDWKRLVEIERFIARHANSDGRSQPTSACRVIKGDGDFMRSICDFSSASHAKRIRRIAKFIDATVEKHGGGK